MSSTSQTAQERCPANLAALHQTLKKMFASTKSSGPTAKARPVVLQGPVIVIRGKEAIFQETKKAPLGEGKQGLFHEAWITSGYTASIECGHPARVPRIPEPGRLSTG